MLLAVLICVLEILQILIHLYINLSRIKWFLNWSNPGTDGQQNNPNFNIIKYQYNNGYII